MCLRRKYYLNSAMCAKQVGVSNKEAVIKRLAPRQAFYNNQVLFLLHTLGFVALNYQRMAIATPPPGAMCRGMMSSFFTS